MDSNQYDSNPVSFVDEEMNHIFLKLAKEFVEEDSFFNPVINTSITPPPPVEDKHVQDLDEPGETTKRQKMVDKSDAGSQGSNSEVNGELGSPQHPVHPNRIAEESYTHSFTKHIKENASQEKYDDNCESGEEVTSRRRSIQKTRNRDLAAIKTQPDIENIGKEIQFDEEDKDDPVIRFLYGPYINLKSGEKYDTRRTHSESSTCLRVDTN